MLFTEISCEGWELCKRVYKAGQVTLACTTATVAIDLDHLAVNSSLGFVPLDF
jgi:hypothetical protein